MWHCGSGWEMYLKGPDKNVFERMVKRQKERRESGEKQGEREIKQLSSLQEA